MPKLFYKGVIAALPIIFGYYFIGFAAGALAAPAAKASLMTALGVI